MGRYKQLPYYSGQPLLLAFLLVALPFWAGAQTEKPKIEIKKEKRSKPEKRGDRRMLLGEHQFAIQEYNEAMSGGDSTAALCFKIAECFRLSNKMYEAMPYYQKAVALSAYQDNAKFYHAYTLKVNGFYDKAGTAFQKYLETSQNPELKKFAVSEINNLNKIKGLAKENDFVTIKNVVGMNTADAEYSPVPWGDKVIYSSTRNKGFTYASTGGGFSDLYEFTYSDTATLQGSTVKWPDYINTDRVNEGTIAFTDSGKTMVFARGNTGHKKARIKDVDLYIAFFKDGQWSQPEMLDFSSHAWDSSPAFSKDGKTLYFASNRAGGYGGVDLYKVVKEDSGWGKLRNLGSKINTPGNDLFPFVSDSGNLYFSSDGHPGLGSLDIFKAAKAGTDIEIVNMGKPFNSPYDDFGYYLIDETPELEAGYLASNRPGGGGDDDVYFFRGKMKPKRLVNYWLEGLIVELPKPQTPGDSASLGLKDTIPSNMAFIRLMDANGKIIQEDTTGIDGKFRFKIDPELNYSLMAGKESFLTKRQGFSTMGVTIPYERLTKPVTDTVLYAKLELDKVYVGEIIEIKTGKNKYGFNDIYYDYDKHHIRGDASEELDKLIQFLNDNSHIRIELSSHCDSRGTDEYNIKLSQRRADAAVKYITGRGRIKKDRVTARGYGTFRHKIEDAQTEEEHQQNRRTEVKITDILKDKQPKEIKADGKDKEMKPEAKGK